MLIFKFYGITALTSLRWEDTATGAYLLLLAAKKNVKIQEKQRERREKAGGKTVLYVRSSRYSQ